MKRFASILLVLYSCTAQIAFPQSAEINRLLSNLNLELSGLEKVKESVQNPESASGELLKYYRSRDFVNHPVYRKDRKAMAGKAASQNEIKTADDALKHIFIGQSAYPPYFCGEDINFGTYRWQLPLASANGLRKPHPEPGFSPKRLNPACIGCLVVSPGKIS